jgi:hypothetical protein
VAGATGHGLAESEKAPSLTEILEIVSGASPEFVIVSGKVAVALIA